MIFPVCKTMSDELFESLPCTSNAQESMHRAFYQIKDNKNDLGFGLQLLVLFAEDLEFRYLDRIKGNKTSYGPDEYWKVNLAA
jgi:hypothetical protein